MTPLVIDFDYLAGFNFQWECGLCGAQGVAFGLAQTWKEANQHREVCNG